MGRSIYELYTTCRVLHAQVILGSFYVHLGGSTAIVMWHVLQLFLHFNKWEPQGFRISAYVAVNNNAALQPDVVGHPEVFMCLGCFPLAKVGLS